MRRFCFPVATFAQAALRHRGIRWNTTMADNESHTGAKASAFSSTPSEANEISAMERASEARREIHDLWMSTETILDPENRVRSVASLIEKYKLDPSTPRENDVSRGLGDAFDRLLLLCIPLGKDSSKGTDDLERLMNLAGRNGREISVRTIQHLFARTDSFSEALAVFYAMRRCHVAMNMEAYYAMLYSLQRLEEEGWAQRFREECEEKGGVSEQAMEFVVKGINNALLPENKPWLGRVMFGDRDVPAQRREARDYDELSAMWTERYRDGSAFPTSP
ncbi:hypothetical protein TCSYLVIO_002640 [Trypanosoma cruzi]|uniref:Uncharacterized protein n=1 Tax=Trypanosoma cruzi TaxID=5693 RepID=A0A2V2UK66_TRYCR|nr:hypothetical protein TCSYLVIO_002640 [Trypanosoma cruzi]KAF8282929.1 kinetoplast ribosomal PPR-repeat containing protein 14 [Trypanosoma cruzi]PBJ72285.1 hypothetical protein BCY84_15871 [Trypanosoma cruzi cruzi]PWU84404.1 hypothetical protein C4B63_230g13 [Trypanosoma cruzi]RNF23258.1 hypothetical protein TcG_01815 [Trypanosoma cruzi]